MSIRIKQIGKKYKYKVIGLLFLPGILYFVNILLLFFYQIGQYFGTFLRNLYEIVV